MAKSLIPVARLLRIPAHGNLEAMAEQRQWQKPVGQARSSAGFVRGALSKELVFPLGNGWSVMTVYLSSRALSAAAVNTALAEKIARILDEEQRKVGSKEKRQLKEDLVFSMLPSAPLVTKEISLFVNQEKNLLLLGSGSEVVADAVARLFHQEQDGELRMPAGLRIPYLSGHLTERLNNWLDDDPEAEVMDELDMAPPLKMSRPNGGAALTFSKASALIDLKEGIAEAIKLAMGVQEVGIHSPADSISLVLTAGTTLKSIVHHGQSYKPEKGAAALEHYANQAVFELAALENVIKRLANEFGEFETPGGGKSKPDQGEGSE